MLKTIEQAKSIANSHTHVIPSQKAYLNVLSSKISPSYNTDTRF